MAYIFGQNAAEALKIDQAHAKLIYGLVVANKPQRILEFGLGGGASTEAILEGISYNANHPHYTLVDNWMDFGGQIPGEILAYLKTTPIHTVTSDEKSFVFDTPHTYDFIMSDADHGSTQQWFEYVYDQLLNPGGILIYHDINIVEEVGVQLREIYFQARKRNLPYHLFNKNSRSEERCQRGLFVLFK